MYCNWGLERGTGKDVNVRRFTYNGSDMLNDMRDERQWWSTENLCQYGGLYLKLLYGNDQQLEYRRICTTLKRNTQLPLTVPEFDMDFNVQIIFATFPGYSSGQISVEFKTSKCNDGYYWKNYCSSLIIQSQLEGARQFLPVQSARRCSQLVLTENTITGTYSPSSKTASENSPSAKIP